MRDAESKFLEGSVIAGLRSQCDKGRVMDYDSFGCIRNNVGISGEKWIHT